MFGGGRVRRRVLRSVPTWLPTRVPGLRTRGRRQAFVLVRRYLQEALRASSRHRGRPGRARGISLVRGSGVAVTYTKRAVMAVMLLAWGAFLGWMAISGSIARYLGPRTYWVAWFGAATLLLAGAVTAVHSIRS